MNFQTDILPLKDRVFRLALRITMNRDEAEDVVQECMIKVWNARDNWQQIENIEAYVLTIGHNIALDHQRRIQRQNEHQTDVKPQELESAQSIDPYDRMIQRERLNIIKQAMDNLPEKQRICMQLRDFEGKSYREIADITGITEDQVKVNIFRARKNIKKSCTEV